MKLALIAGLREQWFHRNRAAKGELRASVRPRLLVDVSVIIRHDAQTGIQRVVRAVWSNLLANSGKTYDVVPVFATKSHGYRATGQNFLSRGASDQPIGKSIHVEPGDKFLGLDLNAHLLPSFERQIASWRAKGVTTHFVVYDLLPLQRPNWFNERTVRNFSRWIGTVRNHCDQALCISDAVVSELRALLGNGSGSPSIARLRLAGDIEGSLPSRGIDEQVARVIEQMQRKNAVLMVGTIEPRKGYDLALAAFEHLWRTNVQAPALVIVGKPGWRTEKLQAVMKFHPEQGKRLFWLPEVSDEGLGELYRTCSGIFLASHAEGFGLPAIEAATHGKHVLVRDLPVFREQSLPNLSYFAADHPAALASELVKLVHRSAQVPSPIVLPTWEDCVMGLLAEMGFSEAAVASSNKHVVA